MTTSFLRRSATPLVLLALGLPGLRAVEPGVLARIGDTEVRVEDIRAALENLEPREQAALARDPALLNQAVRSLLARQVVLKEALAKKWDQQPVVVPLLQRARDNALVETYLQSVSQPPEGFPSEADLQAVYAANQAVLLAPRQYRLAQIFVALPPGSDDAKVARAGEKIESVKKRLGQPGADFAALAKEQSDAPTAATQGGETGWLVEAQIRPEIRSVVARLAPGTVAESLRLEDGWHIVKLLEVKEPYTLSFDEVRGVLAQRIRAERVQANRQAYLAKLLEQNPVSVNEIALSRALAPGKLLEHPKSNVER